MGLACSAAMTGLKRGGGPASGSAGVVDERELAKISTALETLGEIVEPLEAKDGVFRFKVRSCASRPFSSQRCTWLSLPASTPAALPCSPARNYLQYHGLVRNMLGIEAWCLGMAKDEYPQVKSVTFVSKRVRDDLFGVPH